jgi:hypothetical protein
VKFWVWHNKVFASSNPGHDAYYTWMLNDGGEHSPERWTWGELDRESARAAWFGYVGELSEACERAGEQRKGETRRERASLPLHHVV